MNRPVSDSLAIDGGPRTIKNDPPVWPPADREIHTALEDAWADGSWGRYHGPHCGRLIEALAELHDSQRVTLCCSGTFAVELALRGLAIGVGDEVVLAGYDFPGNFRSIEAVGARPVLVDIDPENWSIDATQLPAAIGPQTRGIVISHLHGGMAPMQRVMDFAADRKLLVVEDACQAPGGSIDGRTAGNWGDAGILSFGGSKLLTAGRGGAVITRHAEVQQRMKVFCGRGNQAFPLSELQAAVLLPQLSRLLERNERRRASVAQLLRRMEGLPGLRPVVNRNPTAAPSYYKVAWLYLPADLGGCQIERFVAAMRAEGVPLDTGFRGFARRTNRRCRKVGDLQHCVRAAESTVLLHHPILLEGPQTIDAIAVAFAKVVRTLAR